MPGQDLGSFQEQQSAGDARARHGSQAQISPKAAGIVSSIRDDIRSLNSSVLIITQKMKYLVRNEKILGRNLIVLNKKIRAIEERFGAGSEFGFSSGIASEDTQKLLETLDENNKKIAGLEAEIAELRQSTASQEQLQELKYVIDSINPLEFATIAQVKEMLQNALEKAKKK